jgi:hypothetical protein
MRLFLSLAVSLLALSSAAQAGTVKPIRSADAIDSIGVNTHLNYLDTSYANVQQVVAALKYIGVNQVRDASPSPWNPGAGPLSYYTYAMQQGIHFDFIAHCCVAGFGTDVGQSLDLLKQVPGGITAIEGFNEVDLAPITWMGQTGPAAAIAAQKDLYASFKGNPGLKALSVFDVTGADNPLPASIAARADYANAHLYPQNGNQPNFWFAQMAGFAAARNEPLVVTEFGYASNPESGWLVIGVGEAAQAKAVANGVMSGIEQHIKRTYVYELLDQKPDPQNKDREWHFGLFTTAYQPKPAAVMLSRMTAMMADGGAQSRTFTPHPLTFNFPTLPANTHFVLMEKSTGTSRYLWLWNEAPIWDRATGKPINSPPVSVSINLPATTTAYSYSDPGIQAAPITLYKAGTTKLTVSVPDHPVMIELRGF